MYFIFIKKKKKKKKKKKRGEGTMSFQYKNTRQEIGEETGKASKNLYIKKGKSWCILVHVTTLRCAEGLAGHH